jgi:hypothetical protein
VRRQLVVSADDLRLSAGVNDGIFDAHDHGVLTSASLFANAPATRDAIERLDARQLRTDGRSRYREGELTARQEFHGADQIVASDDHDCVSVRADVAWRR